MDKVKVGIIGVGYLGMQHARITSYLEEAELTAVADIDFKKALEIGNRHGVKYYQNYEDMLDEIDAGIVATPTSEHFRISMNLLEHGKHVLVEKPITETIEQAEQLVETARKNGLILQVGHLERFNPAVEAVETMISEPKFIEVQRLGSFSARSLDVDVVLDLMIHDLDIILALIKDEVDVIRSSGIHVLSDKIDIANARIEFKARLRRDPDRQPRPPGQGPQAPRLRADLLLFDRLHRPGAQGLPPERPADGHQDVQDQEGRAAQEGDRELPPLPGRREDWARSAARRASGPSASPTASCARSRRRSSEQAPGSPSAHGTFRFPPNGIRVPPP